MLKLPELTKVEISMVGITKDISQIQKDLGGLAADFKIFKDSRYVTSNEMQLAISKANDDLRRDFTLQAANLIDKVADIRRIMWLIFGAFVVVIAGSIGRLFLKF